VALTGSVAHHYTRVMLIPLAQECADRAGGIAHLARALRIKHPSIYGWKRIPAERVLQLETITGIPRHKLRADLYPPPRKRGAQ